MSDHDSQTPAPALHDAAAHPRDAGAVRLSRVAKRFGTVTALHPLDLTVMPGQVYGLLGGNGAGKTTLLRILASLIKPDAGSVEVAGIDVVRHPAAVRARIGVVNAGMGLYERLTGRENLEFHASLFGLGAEQRDARIAELSAELGIGPWLRLPAGGYSTGMKQKVVIARAVLHQPPVLILDEASNGLDVLARRALLEFAQDYAAKGRLVIYSTHIMSEAERLCRNAAILDRGELVYCGSIADLCAGHQASDLDDAFYRLALARSTRAAE